MSLLGLPTYMDTYICTYWHTHRDQHTHTHTDTQTHTHTHTHERGRHAHAHKHTHLHTHTHTHTHTHKHTHTHTDIRACAHTINHLCRPCTCIAEKIVSFMLGWMLDEVTV